MHDDLEAKPKGSMRKIKVKEVRPVIVNYDCWDHDPIESYEPMDPTDVDYWMTFTIGPDRTAGDLFQVHIVTPGNLRGANAGKYAIVLNYYDWSSVLSEVEGILDRCRGRDWGETCEKLAKHFYWEYENYRG
jgi:hypothetical protein